MEPIRKALFAICVLLLLIGIGTEGFMYLEGLSQLDAFYLTVVTLTTVGYGDIAIHTDYGKLFAAGLIISGIGITLYVVSKIMQSVLEGGLIKAFDIAWVIGNVAKMKKHRIICGGGRTGSVIAEEFKKAGLDFVVIEHDPEVANELRKKNLTVVEGDATREETLKKAGVERASGLVATLPSDSDNLFLCFTAKELNKNIEIVTRASSEEAAKRLHSIGAKKAIIVEEIGGKMLARCLISDTP